ncbi:hypothetical protein HOY82DRAFT_619193 [Tuber indicum]|nr:hypothetical protein HOY82DRAFT_619193 [Tuber indicum]
MSFENSLLETFNNIPEQGDFGSPDNEFLVHFLDQEPGCSAPCNAGINFTSPLGEYSREAEAGPGCSESREHSKIEPPEKNVVQNIIPSPLRQTLENWFADTGSGKRANTDEEKEQRRVERILRNGAAARPPRERK